MQTHYTIKATAQAKKMTFKNNIIHTTTLTFFCISITKYIGISFSDCTADMIVYFK